MTGQPPSLVSRTVRAARAACRDAARPPILMKSVRLVAMSCASAFIASWTSAGTFSRARMTSLSPSTRTVV
jgi:hypothetical protein